ncbi:glutamate decarboxylase [Tepidibacillus marianensis]|uniref:glutamate decarboxylase n=1 Tax=Tepidibacillus marianensis TaxID=3131995 RepID=UPI0030D3A191
MWTVIYISPNEKIATKIKDQLTAEGFLVKVRESQISNQFEILVPKGELSEIREVLAAILS